MRRHDLTKDRQRHFENIFKEQRLLRHLITMLRRHDMTDETYKYKGNGKDKDKGNGKDKDIKEPHQRVILET